MKIDLDQEIKLTKYNMLQIFLICLALGAGLALLNDTLGIAIIGAAVLFFALPIIIKVFGHETT